MPLFTLFISYFMTYIHSFNHNTFIRRYSLKPLSIALHFIALKIFLVYSTVFLTSALQKRSDFFLPGNFCFEFSVQCLCSVHHICPSLHTKAQDPTLVQIYCRFNYVRLMCVGRQTSVRVVHTSVLRKYVKGTQA